MTSTGARRRSQPMRHVLGFPASMGLEREWSVLRHAALMLTVLAISGCQTPVPPVKSAPTSSSASVRLDRLATEVRERELDLFPIAETLDNGAGPRQGRLELDFTAEHRERKGRITDGFSRGLPRFPWPICRAANGSLLGC